MRILLITLCVLLLVACSTAQIKSDTAKPIPEERIYDNKYFERVEGKENVIFIRDQGILGSACTHTIYIDNDKAFVIKPGEIAIVNLSPGNHFFRLEFGAGFYPDESHSQSTYLDIGEPHTFRISASSNFNTMLTRIK